MQRTEPSCRWIGGWTGAYALNALIATYFLIFGVGFGIWAAIANLASNVHQYSVFAKCYQVDCDTPQPLLQPSTLYGHACPSLHCRWPLCVLLRVKKGFGAW